MCVCVCVCVGGGGGGKRNLEGGANTAKPHRNAYKHSTE